MPVVAPPEAIALAVAEWHRASWRTSWRGQECQQFPADVWRYAELCWELRPPFVLETGTASGGTALFLADVLEAVGGGVVLTVDIRNLSYETVASAAHPRVRPLVGDSVDPAVADAITALADGRRGLVLLDGDHSSAQVAKELDLYAPLADYLIVEDTIMRWLDEYDDGPHLALDAWLPRHPEFAPDFQRPDPVPTQHPGGWLRRVAG